MNHHYSDIRDAIATPPLWWDEHAVPRYCVFATDQTASVYAEEVVLLKIRCQSCGRAFEVCMTWTSFDLYRSKTPALSDQIRAKTIHYGDPPNVECCPAGPTMNSEPDRVLQFWRVKRGVSTRDASLEVSVEDADGGGWTP